jgi:hypothetical protein
MTNPLNILAGHPPANIKDNPPQGKELLMRDRLKIARDAIARRACIFNFLPLFTSRCSLAGLSRKLKKSSSAIFATRAKRAVNPCLDNNELISKLRK